MLQRHILLKIIKTSIVLFVLFLLNIFPQNNDYFNEEAAPTFQDTIPIYAIDPNGYVARIESLKDDKLNDIENIINLLTSNSTSHINLPQGFITTIPSNTKLLSYELQEGLLKLNFSKELLNVTDTEKLIESLIFSLCELDNVQKIQIYVENKLLEYLPNSLKRLPTYLDKDYGINKKYNINNIKETTKATIYYLGKVHNTMYYIPITKISNEKIEAVEVIVHELQNSPIYEPNLISYLNASYELQDYQILENTISLSFNNLLIANLDDQDIEEKVKYTLALSLRDTYHIDDINIILH